MGKKAGSRIRDEPPRSFFRELRYSFLGYKNLNSLMRIRIQDPGDETEGLEGEGLEGERLERVKLERERLESEGMKRLFIV
jgi:hypothetical protein